MEPVARSDFAQLDHLFLFVADEAAAQAMMRDAGLRVNYSREHPGQGTRNLCACLDDIFLELLWLDGSAISAQSEAITLGARGRGEGSPLGVSWRGSSPFEETAGGVVPYHAPFLPAGVSIPVAAASLDPALPFVFRTPGGTPPIERTDGLVGDRQFPELARMARCEISVPDPGPVATLLRPFEKLDVVQGLPGLSVTIQREDGSTGRKVKWLVDGPEQQ